MQKKVIKKDDCIKYMETKTTKVIMEKVANNFFISKRFIGFTQ